MGKKGMLTVDSVEQILIGQRVSEKGKVEIRNQRVNTS
jgi:hypothetical protein